MSVIVFVVIVIAYIAALTAVELRRSKVDREIQHIRDRLDMGDGP